MFSAWDGHRWLGSPSKGTTTAFKMQDNSWRGCCVSLRHSSRGHSSNAPELTHMTWSDQHPCYWLQWWQRWCWYQPSRGFGYQRCHGPAGSEWVCCISCSTWSWEHHDEDQICSRCDQKQEWPNARTTTWSMFFLLHCSAVWFNSMFTLLSLCFNSVFLATSVSCGEECYCGLFPLSMQPVGCSTSE